MRVMNMVAWAAAAIGLAAATPGVATADTAKGGRPHVGFVMQGEFEFGGDDIATVNFDDGSTQDVKAGQGVTLALGGYFRPASQSPFALRATVGYKLVMTKASNADIRLTRIPLELVGTYRLTDNVWAGLGAVYHTNVKFDADGFGENIDFDPATGATLELGWRWLALTYTNIKYKAPGLSEHVDASSVGVTLTSKF